MVISDSVTLVSLLNNHLRLTECKFHLKRLTLCIDRARPRSRVGHSSIFGTCVFSTYLFTNRRVSKTVFWHLAIGRKFSTVVLAKFATANRKLTELSFRLVDASLFAMDPVDERWMPVLTRQRKSLPRWCDREINGGRVRRYCNAENTPKLRKHETHTSLFVRSHFYDRDLIVRARIILCFTTGRGVAALWPTDSDSNSAFNYLLFLAINAN